MKFYLIISFILLIPKSILAQGYFVHKDSVYCNVIEWQSTMYDSLVFILKTKTNLPKDTFYCKDKKIICISKQELKRIFHQKKSKYGIRLFEIYPMVYREGKEEYEIVVLDLSYKNNYRKFPLRKPVLYVNTSYVYIYKNSEGNQFQFIDKYEVPY